MRGAGLLGRDCCRRDGRDGGRAERTANSQRWWRRRRAVVSPAGGSRPASPSLAARRSQLLYLPVISLPDQPVATGSRDGRVVTVVVVVPVTLHSPSCGISADCCGFPRWGGGGGHGRVTSVDAAAVMMTVAAMMPIAVAERQLRCGNCCGGGCDCKNGGGGGYDRGRTDRRDYCLKLASTPPSPPSLISASAHNEPRQLSNTVIPPLLFPPLVVGTTRADSITHTAPQVNSHGRRELRGGNQVSCGDRGDSGCGRSNGVEG